MNLCYPVCFSRMVLFGFNLALVSAVAAAPDPSTRPDASRFTPMAVTQPGALDEPMTFEILPDGRVYIAERKGALKVYDPAIGGVKVAGVLAVNTFGNNE